MPDELKHYFPQVIDLMPQEFTAHQFIRALAAKQPHAYIQALNSAFASENPFKAVHTYIGKTLHEFNDLIEYIDDIYDLNMFGNRTEGGLWRKKS